MLEMMPLLNLTTDVVFKSFLQSSKIICTDVLQAYVQDLKDSNATVVSYLNTLPPPHHPEGKSPVLDVVTQMSNRSFANVELQCMVQKYFSPRALLYWCYLYANQIERGDDYAKLQPTYSIIFTDFSLFANRKKYISPFGLLCLDDPRVVLSPHIQFITIELNKLRAALVTAKKQWKGDLKGFFASLDRASLWGYHYGGIL